MEYEIFKKIESKKPVTLDDLKALPDRNVNKRYSGTTFLFFALSFYNLLAIDVLLEAGADPFMIDEPSSGFSHDFLYLLSIYLKNDLGKHLSL